MAGPIGNFEARRVGVPPGGLPPEELRVLACLVEKQLTTPQQYPLTLNALVSACNQTQNRHPVVNYDERAVETAVTAAKSRGLARFVHPSHGRSALRFAHSLDTTFGLDTRRLALLSVLALRGPQTVGELRGRTDRMVRFADLPDVETELEAMASSDLPLVVRLRRQPGQKEDRYRQCLGEIGGGAQTPGFAGDEVAALSEADDSAGASVGAGRPEHSAGRRDTLAADVDDVRRAVEGLRRDLQDVRRDLDELRARWRT